MEQGSDWDIPTAQQGGRLWMQMLARSGVSHIPVGDPASAVFQYFEKLAAVATEDAGVVAAEGGHTNSSSTPTSASATESSATSSSAMAPEAAASASDAASAGPRAQVSRRGPTGTNPALKRTEEVVDDGEDLATFPDLPDNQRQQQLEVLNQQVQGCTQCPELVDYRTQTVFGVGNIRPRLVMMGEAPGADEDRLGEPMVGLAGQLLDKIIAAMKLKRQDVYILNTVKCRPPQNRNPTEIECSQCRPYWRQQLEILRPDCIVCLGAVASKTLLQTTAPVGRLRGQFHDYRGVPVAVTYHPAYLLRTESAKRHTWEDMKMVMELLGISI